METPREGFTQNDASMGPQQGGGTGGSMDSGAVSDVGNLHPSASSDNLVDGQPSPIAWGNSGSNPTNISSAPMFGNDAPNSERLGR